MICPQRFSFFRRSHLEYLLWTRLGRGPDQSEPGGGNLPVNDGRVVGAGWANPSNSIPLHGSTPDGLFVPDPCPIKCINNNEAFSFHPTGIAIV